jgi:hypothetical protein
MNSTKSSQAISSVNAELEANVSETDSAFIIRVTCDTSTLIMEAKLVSAG